MNFLNGDVGTSTTQGSVNVPYFVGGEQMEEEVKSESASSKIFDDNFTRQHVDDFICWICRFQVNEPVTCSNGHLFCRDCVSRWIHPLSIVTATAVNSNRTTYDIANGVLDLTSSANQKPYCPTCRVTLKLEDLKPILGAADSQQFSNGYNNSAKLSKRASQRNIRVTRFNFLRDAYESEIEKLLSEIDDLEEQLDWCRNGSQVKFSREAQTEEPFTSSLQKATSNLEKAVELSVKLKQDNDRLHKEKEDWEMAKLNLTRELRLATENRSGGGTPQKYGKFVITSLESKIESLEKENHDLKKVLERQDKYVKELESQKGGPQQISNQQSSSSSRASLQDNSQISNLSNTHNAQSNNRSSLANMSLPSPFRKINLNSEKLGQSSNCKKMPSEIIVANGTNEGSSSKEGTLREISASPSQTKRALRFSREQEEFQNEKQNSVSSEQTSPDSKARFQQLLEEASRSRPGLETSDEFKESAAGKSADKTKPPTSSKIPRPRSQSPGQALIEVRRSPRKLGNNAESIVGEKKSVTKSTLVLNTENQSKSAENTDERIRGSICSSFMPKDLNAKLRLLSKEQGLSMKVNEAEVESDQSSASLSLGSSTKSRRCYLELSNSVDLNGSTEHTETPIPTMNSIQTLENGHPVFEPIASQAETNFPLDQTSLSSQANLKQSSDASGSTEDLDLNEIFCSTQKRVESRAARKNSFVNSTDSNTAQENVDHHHSWKGNSSAAVFASSSSLSSSICKANSGYIKGGIQPVVELENLPDIAKNGYGNSLKLDLNLGSLNTFDALLSPLSPMSSQKNFVPDEENSSQRSSSRSHRVVNLARMTSSPEFDFTAVPADASAMTSSNNEASGNNLKYLSEVDETLAEIIKLKGQSIQSLASASTFSKQGPIFTNNGASPQNPPSCSSFYSQSQLPTPQKSRSQDVSNNLTPRSNSKRKFQEVNSNTD